MTCGTRIAVTIDCDQFVRDDCGREGFSHMYKEAANKRRQLMDDRVVIKCPALDVSAGPGQVS